ncbi:hypothetical protein BGX24_006118, partial [Mortierella sp. AD032]
MTFELPPIGHALSGGVAAALANVVIYPLDMATTRVQSQSTKDSSSATFATSSLAPASSGQNSSSSEQHQELQPIEFKRPALPGSTSSSSSSATTSAVSVGEDGRKKTTRTTITTTTTTTRVLAGTSSSSSTATTKRVHYTSVPNAIRQIYATEGFRALYSGLGSDTIATLTSNF